MKKHWILCALLCLIAWAHAGNRADINADQVVVTGRKEEGKLYRRHSGFMGGLKSETVREVRKRRPARIVEEAVRGMLPKTKLGRAMFLKLKVYGGPKHPHQAQKPQPLTL